MNRRSIDFRSAKEVIDDVEALRSGGYEKIGNWNLTQMCQHLTATMDGGMNGFGFRLPWILRATVVRWSFGYFLKKRKLFRGAPTFPVLRPTHVAASDDNDVIDEFVRCCERADQFDGSLADYALLDDLCVEDWRDFMWLHSSHHLSFLVPKS